jgi:hypothetical protein
MHKNPTKDCRFAFANKSNVAASYENIPIQ